MVYLDYAATTPMLPEVITAVADAERRFFANASALHTPGHLALNAIEKTRELLATLINCRPSEIIFTSCASESNNTVVGTFAGHQIHTSPLEHHSILEPARKYRGAKLPALYSFMLANNETGEFLTLPTLDRTPLDPEALDRASSDPEKSPAASAPRPKSTSRDSSPRAPKKSSAATSPTSAATSFAPDDLLTARDAWGHPLVTDRRRAYLHSDLTQVLGKIPLDVQKLQLDYATFAAHKIGGPLGVGALYVRTGVPFKPFMLGGLQEQGRRGGTYNTPAIVGFGAALQNVLDTRPWQLFDTKTRALRDTLAHRILQEIPGSSLNTDLDPEKSLPNILNVSFRAAEGESIQLYLDAAGIVVSTGSACAAGDTKPSHVLMAKTGDAEVAHSSIRFSFGLANTPADVDAVMAVLPGIVRRLQQISTIS